MATQLNPIDIKTNQDYGILTWGGASSGAWLIAPVVSVGKDGCVYEVQTGPNKLERRRCKISEIYDAKECALESIRNRPEHSAAYQRYL